MQISVTQNFLKDAKLVSKLVEQASINNSDIVLDLGAGKGIITKELAKYSKKVIAVELDPVLANQLKKDVSNLPSVEVEIADILNFPLPSVPYKVFSNIPFNITSEIINKLLFATNTPEDCFLIMQKEAANRFMGRGEGTLWAALIKPLFKLSIIYEFGSKDFQPKPAVKVVLFRAEKNPNSFTSVELKRYRDFVSYIILQQKQTLKKRVKQIFMPAEFYTLCGQLGIDPLCTVDKLTMEQWYGLFRLFNTKIADPSNAALIKYITGKFENYKTKQASQPKSHKSRAVNIPNSSKKSNHRKYFLPSVV